MRLSRQPRLATFLVGLLLSAGLIAPLPYVILDPGGGQDVLGSVIKISQRQTYPTSGKLLLTTVLVTGPSSVVLGADVLRSWFVGNSIVLPRNFVYEPHQSAKELDKKSVTEMVDSQQSAIAAALKYLKIPFTTKIVVGKNGVKTANYVFPFPVSITLKDTGGPSGGLVFALGIIDKLTPSDLLKGRVVAGTGTVDSAGNIGAIGGVDDKLIAAKKAGATVFLAPSANCTDVTRIPSGIAVYSVATLSEAVSVLENSKNAIPHCTWQRNR